MFLLKRIIVYLRNLLDLHEDKELEQKTIESITRNITFRGTRLWVLAFAILIASIGLNVNSAAVVIGAMLISPLMGPIVGTGLALGIHDFGLLKKSLLNLMNATVISFLVSSLYFWITPLGQAQSEILARTTPTIYDVLIAFFGGMAGIIGSSRRDKGIILPGVAIATALMPPLCTAGYGFATGQYQYFFGAFYLYLINCTFISLATFIMVKYLGYTTVQILDRKKEKQMRWYMAVVITCMVVPSTYFAYRTIEKTAYTSNVENYIRSVFTSKGYTVIYKNITYPEKPAVVELAFLDQTFLPTEIDSLQELMTRYKVDDTKLIIKQRPEQFTDNEWMRVMNNLENSDEKIKALESKMKVAEIASISPQQLGQELKAINAKVEKVEFGQPFDRAGKGVVDSASLVVVFKLAQTPVFSNTEATTMRNWLKLRLQKDTVITVFATLDR